MAHRTSSNSLAPLATNPMGGFKAFFVNVSAVSYTNDNCGHHTHVGQWHATECGNTFGYLRHPSVHVL